MEEAPNGRMEETIMIITERERERERTPIPKLNQ